MSREVSSSYIHCNCQSNNISKRPLSDGNVSYSLFLATHAHSLQVLGWWFAIRTAWPNSFYRSPDHLMQKVIWMHRPVHLMDNSVAAAGVWHNILVGTRAEHCVDLKVDVQHLRLRKQMGKLSIN